MTKSSVMLIAVLLSLPSGRSGIADDAVKPEVKQPASHEEAFAVAEKTPGVENLKLIGLALYEYHDHFGQFPAAVHVGPDGRTLHSWRVELLPLLKECAAANPADLTGDRAQWNARIAACGYDINQSWDSVDNRAMLKSMAQVFRHPLDRPDSVATAFYAVVGPGTAFDPGAIAKYDIDKYVETAWLHSTLMVFESRSREPWTKPVDIAYSKFATVPRFGGFTKDGFLALACGGAVHYASDAVAPEDLRGFISKDTTDAFNIVGVPCRFKE